MKEKQVGEYKVYMGKNTLYIVGEGICKFVHNGTSITPRDALYIPHIRRNFVSISVVDERRYEVG